MSIIREGNWGGQSDVRGDQCPPGPSFGSAPAYRQLFSETYGKKKKACLQPLAMTVQQILACAVNSVDMPHKWLWEVEDSLPNVWVSGGECNMPEQIHESRAARAACLEVMKGVTRSETGKTFNIIYVIWYMFEFIWYLFTLALTLVLHVFIKFNRQQGWNTWLNTPGGHWERDNIET